MQPTAAEVICDWEIARANRSRRLPDAVRDAYDGVDLQAARELAVQATLLLETASPGDAAVDRERATVLLLRLACLCPGALNGLHSRLLDQRVPEAMGWPMAVDREAVFYRGGALVRDRLLSELQEAPPVEETAPTRLLLSLAWVDDDVVLSAFDEWIRLDPPPPWVPAPYRERAPSWLALFPPSAGWTIAADGCRRPLVASGAARLVEGGDTEVASVGGQVAENCGWCGGPLTVLLDLRLTDRLQFLGLAGERLVVPTCEFCTCYATVFVDVSLDGAARWSDVNVRPEHLPAGEIDERIPRGVRGLGPQLRSPLATMAFGSAVELSHVGGLPAWIQDAQYPACPRCGELMPFLGQVDTSEVAWGEGAIYAFYDAACALAATVYQQT